MSTRREQMTGDTLDNLEESIQIEKTMESRLLEKFGTGESPDAGKDIQEALDDFNKPDGIPLEAFLFSVRSIVGGALGEVSLCYR